MDKQSRRLMAGASGVHIVNVELLRTDGLQQVVLNVVNKKQRLYSLVARLQPDQQLSTVPLRNDFSASRFYDEFTGQQIHDIISQDDIILVCTSGSYLRLNTRTQSVKVMTHNEGYTLQQRFVLEKHGF